MGHKYHKQYRLPGFDYSGEGEYFVTICTANHEEYFGEIEEGKMILSEMGKLVEKVWKAIPEKFENTGVDSYQVMPDHFHGIIILKEGENFINKIPTLTRKPVFKSGIQNNPMELKEVSLGKIIRWFKSCVKYESGKINPAFKWQSRFYDRIIRNDIEYYFISEYIENNPVNRGKGIIRNYFNKIG